MKTSLLSKAFNLSEMPGDDLQKIRAQIENRKAEEEKTIVKLIEETKGTITSDEILLACNSNQDGDASLYIRVNCKKFCYDHASKRWYIWRDHYWEEDLLDENVIAIENVINLYALEANNQAFLETIARKDGKESDAESCKKTRNLLLSRINLLRTLSRKKSVLRLVTCGNEGLGIIGNEWDQKPMLLACKNGVIDLETALVFDPIHCR